MTLFDKKITAVVGHYGCGKTNIAIEIALRKKRAGAEVVLADIDIVNPYFRAEDARGFLQSRGIELVSTAFANTNLDIPVVSADLEAALIGNKQAVLDVGGDDAGAVVLGRCKRFFREGEYDMFYVVNQRRLLTATPQEALEVMRGIESATGVAVTGIVNNTNLGELTTPETVKDSAAYAAEIARLAGVPLAATFALGGIAAEVKGVIPLEIRTRRYF